MKTFFNFIVANNPVRISPKENSGANGKFLPKPLLFHLRLPNSKKISRVFCEILSPKNSFRKTESALVPPRLYEAVAGLIHSFSFRSKKVRAKSLHILNSEQVTTGAPGGTRTLHVQYPDWLVRRGGLGSIGLRVPHVPMPIGTPATEKSPLGDFLVRCTRRC